MTYLAVPVKVVDFEQALRAARQAAGAGAEMLELRLDYLRDPTPAIVDHIVSNIKELQLPMIATCRPEW